MGRPRGRGRLRRRLSLGLYFIVSKKNCSYVGTYAVIGLEDGFFSWFSLPIPRLAHPRTLRRAPGPDRDWESESELPLAIFPGFKEETSAATVFTLTVRCCSARGGAGNAESAGADAGFGAKTVGSSELTVKGDKEILTARCGCG